MQIPPQLTQRPKRSGKPLLTICAVRSLLDRNEDQVLRLIDGGGLAWVFDVGLEPRPAKKRTLRVLPAAVADCINGRPCALTWPEVLALLLPQSSTLNSSELAQTLNVSRSHVLALARRRLIKTCSPWHRGRGGAGRFSTNSVTDFLRSRRAV
jgi:hypothetical protein